MQSSSTCEGHTQEQAALTRARRKLSSMIETHGGGEDATGKDWLFDYLLSVFKSPQWDVAVMGFIDENCAVFDNDEENKLAYTDLHHQFKDLVESLCSSSLTEVGVAVEDFVEALEASRLSQDISQAVYEQLIALDDYRTFKKLMVKRNVELELEAVRALQEQGVPVLNGTVDNGKPDENIVEEKCDEDGRQDLAAIEGSAAPVRAKGGGAGPRSGRTARDKQLQKAMDANLRELELMHKREEVEQAELEQAIAMSLALETKRVGLEAQRGGNNGHSKGGSTLRMNGGACGDEGGGHDVRNGISETDCKGVASDQTPGRRRQSKDEDARKASDGLAEAKCDFSCPEEKQSSSNRRKGNTWGYSKALPPLSRPRGEKGKPFRLGGGCGLENFRDPDVEAAERRREAQEASQKAQQFLTERRRAQEVLKSQSEVSEADSAKRERHLKDLRDRIVSAKRAGREEEASKTETLGLAQPRVDTAAVKVPAQDAKSAGAKNGEDTLLVVNGDRVEEDFAEEQRHAMRVALARRMKRELIESEQERFAKVQSEQLADLNGKLRLVEKLRDDNSEREAEIARGLRQQQQQRARNVAKSAAAAQGNSDDEFTFGEGG